jgi:amidase
MWNILHYPSVVLPITTVDKLVDIQHESYVPCNEHNKKSHNIYNPKLFEGTPASLQLVGRALAEEKLLAIADAVDLSLQQRE